MPPLPARDEAVLRRQRSERLSRIMWGYICGGITVLSFVVGLGPSFIPLGFGVLGCILAWPLCHGGDRRHSTVTGALALGGIMIWLTHKLADDRALSRALRHRLPSTQPELPQGESAEKADAASDSNGHVERGYEGRDVHLVLPPGG